MKISQKYYGSKSILFVLAFLSAFPPMTTDIYLPALPSMVDTLESSRALINLTLSLFFVSFAFGLLLWGPLSEKYGRKPILFTGLAIYIAASLGCAFSSNVHQLIVARIFQAIGGAATTAISTALVKDIYDDARRARILATIMSMVIIAPILAPIIGAQLLKFASWRALFLCLTGVGIFATILVFFISETVTQKSTLSVARSLLRPFVLIRKPSISLLLVLFSSTSLPLMAYLAAASFIYSKNFGLSEEQFSLFFAFNAFCAMLGPIIYIRISKHLSTKVVISGCYSGIILGGIIILFTAHLSPYLFALGASITTISIIAMRPAGTNLILEQHDSDTGSLSSLINFSSTVVGSIGMAIISIDGIDQMNGMAFLALTVGSVGFVSWQLILKKKSIRYQE